MTAELVLTSTSVQQSITIAAKFARIPKEVIIAVVQVEKFCRPTAKPVKILIHAPSITADVVRFARSTKTAPFVHVEMVSRLI